MFCICGTFVHVRADSRKIVCLRCRRQNGVEMIQSVHVDVAVQRAVVEVDVVEGARIKQQCPACGSEEMMYNTAQLRSADEGQTVFYTCKCGHKLTVQS